MSTNTSTIATEDYLREMAIIFFAQKKVIVLTTLIIFLGALAIAFFYPPTYSIKGAILVKSKQVEKTPEALEDTERKQYEINKEDLYSEAELFSSTDVLRQTIERLQESGAPYADLARTPQAVTQAVTQLQNRVQTQVAPDTNIVEVQLLTKNPTQGLQVMQTLFDVYFYRRGEIYTPPQYEDFFSAQVDRYEDSMLMLEDKLMDLAKQYNTPDPLKEIESNLQIKRELVNDLNTSRNTLVEELSMVKHLRTSVMSQDIKFFSSINNTSINSLGNRLQELFIQREDIFSIYHEESEKANMINEQIDNVYSKLKKEVEDLATSYEQSVAMTHDKIDSLESRVHELDSRNIELNNYSIQIQQIKRKLELQRHSFETFSKRREEALITTGSESSNLFNISVFNRPFFTGSPVFPNKRTVIPMGLIAGFIAGCALGYLFEFFDHSFKKPEDLWKFGGLEPIFSVPKYQR